MDEGTIVSISDFLREPKVSLPKTRVEGTDFLEYITTVFSEFIADIQTIPQSDNLTRDVLQQIPFIKEQALAIQEALTSYYAGYPQQAYDRLALLFDTHKNMFERLYSAPIETEYLKSMYRLRTQGRGDFSREQMFHIPFQSRHLVRTQRYSIPGFPSLYTSSSIYIAWKELRCPAMDTVYAVRLESPERLRVLDLGYTPAKTAELADLYTKSRTNNKRLYDVVFPKILFWPLQAACSIRVLNEEAPFKPEYIIPQILLQYVKQNGKDIDGIRYFSMHFGQREHHLALACNFVFPVRSSHPTGICSILQKKFKVTEVVPWQIAQTFTTPMNLANVADTPIELVRGVPVLYRNTEFGMLEGRFHELPASYL